MGGVKLVTQTGIFSRPSAIITHFIALFNTIVD